MKMLVFAPGRIREHFKLDVKGNELIISYTPPQGFPKSEWVRREYSRGGFERIFTLDETIDTGNHCKICGRRTTGKPACYTWQRTGKA